MTSRNDFKEIPLDGLEVGIKLKWNQILSVWYIENRFTYPLRVFVVQSKPLFALVARLHRFLSSRFVDLKTTLDKYSRSVARLSSADKSGYELDSDFGYSGDVFVSELMTAHKYKKQIDSGFSGPGESRALYDHIISVSADLLKASGAKHYFNFGVCYAYTDSILAKEFPDVSFVGIERTPAGKIYNDQFFSDIGNLSIIFGDIFEHLSKTRYDGGVFFHSRTLLLLPVEFVRKLYAAVHAAGFKYILATEPYGLSRQTRMSYRFSYNPQDSVVYRDFMYIHNWPNILKDCGFCLQRIEALKTGHPHQDMRMLSFSAEALSS